MGGKGSGGARVGAGRKSKTDQQHWLGGDAGHRHGKELPKKQQAIDRFGPPKGLPDLHLDVWKELAPHAFDARTLTKGTAGAFRDLCEAIVVRDGLLTRIHQDGYMDDKGNKHPLLTDYRGMMQRVEAGLQRFRLAPMGKEILVSVEPEDPFDEFDDGADPTKH